MLQCVLVAGWLVDAAGLQLLVFFSIASFVVVKFVVVPFEEKELVAIFGFQYESYARVPILIPFTKRHKTNEH